MRAIIVSCLLTFACDSSTMAPPTDMAMQQITDPTTGLSDDAPHFPPDMSTLPVIEYIDCDMGLPPFLRIDGGFCIFCYAPNRPCCATAPKCSSDTTCNDAGPLNWCQ